MNKPMGYTQTIITK